MTSARRERRNPAATDGGLVIPLLPQGDSQLPTDLVYLTRPEVAKRLRVAEKTLRKWASEKRGPRHIRLGANGPVRYPAEEFFEWERQQHRQ